MTDQNYVAASLLKQELKMRSTNVKMLRLSLGEYSLYACSIAAMCNIFSFLCAQLIRTADCLAFDCLGPRAIREQELRLPTMFKVRQIGVTPLLETLHHCVLPSGLSA
jgi:hypothetical protein